jgi:dipeptidyl aminopeptidase/acylaminoacyl peptidase
MRSGFLLHIGYVSLLICLVTTISSCNSSSQIQTPIPPTLFPTTYSMPTATLSATETGQSACLDVTSTSSIKLPSEKLVLSDGSNFEILNPRTGQINEFSKPNERIYSPIVSPQRKWLAFRRTGGLSATQSNPFGQLIVVSSDGKIAKQLEWENNWESLGYWLDEQNIVVELSRNPPSTLSPLLLLNVTTGATKMLLPDFPGIDDLTRLDWSSSGKTIYNPTTTKVIYPTLGENGRAYILWSIQENKIIASLPTRDFSLDGPHWSPDGRGFVVVAIGDNISLGKNEFYWVGADGAISQITSFRNEYSKIDLRKWSWSPNGQYISYWYQIGDGSTQAYALGVLEVSTGKSENYCITSLRDFLREPLWTVDSSDIALYLTKPNEIETQTVLLDIQNRTVSIVGSNLYPIGWLNPTFRT